MPPRARPKVDRGEPYLSVKDAAALLDVSIRTIYNMLSSGRLRGYKVHKQGIRIKRSDLEAALTEYRAS